MGRQLHWTGLVAWLVLTWCATLISAHFLMPDSWAHTFGTGLVEIPVWAGIGYLTHRRAKRRSQQPRLPSE
jgi:hypothetical protein